MCSSDLNKDTSLINQLNGQSTVDLYQSNAPELPENQTLDTDSSDVLEIDEENKTEESCEMLEQ